jgi:hypothetical protein
MNRKDVHTRNSPSDEEAESNVLQSQPTKKLKSAQDQKSRTPHVEAEPVRPRREYHPSAKKQKQFDQEAADYTKRSEHFEAIQKVARGFADKELVFSIMHFFFDHSVDKLNDTRSSDKKMVSQFIAAIQSLKGDGHSDDVLVRLRRSMNNTFMSGPKAGQHILPSEVRAAIGSLSRNKSTINASKRTAAEELRSTAKASRGAQEVNAESESAAEAQPSQVAADAQIAGETTLAADSSSIAMVATTARSAAEAVVAAD